jgi:sugar phosphate isomerase/epimerase
MWPTGLSLNAFVGSETIYGLHFELQEILNHARDLGYDGIELSPFHQPYPQTPRDQRNLKKLYQSYGLAIPALYAFCQGQAGSPDKNERKLYVESLKPMFDLANNLGAGVVGVGSGMAIRGVPVEEQVNWVVETYRQCGQFAERAQITLALEPEPVHVIDSLEELLIVLDGVDLPCFTTIFDVSHANVLSRCHPLEFLRSIQGRVGLVHFTDNDGQILSSGVEGASHTSKHLAVGDGNVDLNSILDALRRMNYSGWIQVDVWENPDPFRASMKAKRFLEAFRQ